MSLRERLQRSVAIAVPAVPAVLSVICGSQPQKPQQPQASEFMRGTWLEGVPTLDQDREIRERVAALYGQHPDSAVALELALNHPETHLSGLRDVWPMPTADEVSELHRVAVEWYRLIGGSSEKVEKTIRSMAPGRVARELGVLRSAIAEWEAA